MTDREQIRRDEEHQREIWQRRCPELLALKEQAERERDAALERANIANDEAIRLHNKLVQAERKLATVTLQRDRYRSAHAELEKMK